MAHSHLLLIDNPGITIATVGRALIFRGRNIKLTVIPKDIRVIIMDAYGGAITTPAVSMAASRKVEILIASRAHGSMALFTPAPLIDARRATLKLRELQFRAVFNSKKTVEIAKAIVERKIKVEQHRREIAKAMLAELTKAKTTDDVRHVEAKAAQVWWRQWARFEMVFKGAGVPTEWRAWPGRYIGRRQGILGELSAQFTARGAVHPLQAMLNYATGVLAGRMTRVVIAKGLDASFGFLHNGRKPGRLSIVWDCVELHRPALVTAVFGLTNGRAFRKGEFGIFEHGTNAANRIAEGVGLLSPLAREVAEVTIRTVPLRDMIKTVDWITKQIRS